MKLWKVLGLAGVAGVAATGVAVARGERRRRAYEPAEVRDRLHQRHAEALQARADRPAQPQVNDQGRAAGRPRRPWARARAARTRRRTR